MSAQHTEVIPQVGTGEAGESHPSASLEAEGCLTDSGGGKHSCRRPEQRGGNKEEINPFARSKWLQRTPPRPRTWSLPDESMHLIEAGQSSKRKRIEGNMATQKRCGRQTEYRGIFLDALENVVKQAKQLEKLIKETYKPKQELKEISGKLLLQVERLQGKELRDWLDESISGKAYQEADALRSEINNLRKEVTDAKQAQRTELANLGQSRTQCASCMEEQRKEARRQQLSQDDSYATFKLVTEEDGRDGVFPKIRVQQGNIWEAPSDALILPCNPGITTPHKAVAKIIEKLGEKGALVKQGKEKGEVAMMLHSLGFPSRDGTFASRSRVMYYPIISKFTACNKTLQNLPYRNWKVSPEKY